MQEVAIIEPNSEWDTYAQDFSVYIQRTEFTSKINELVAANKHRLILNLDHMRQTSPDLVKILFEKPSKSISLLETSLKNICNETRGADPSVPKKKLQGSVTQKEPAYTVGFEGNFGKFLITPRGLTSNIVNRLVAVKGIVTRMSYVRPKLVHSVHYCDVTRVGRVKEYHDQYSIAFDNLEPPSSNAYPTKDENNNPLTTEYGFCHYRDNQTLLLQEMPEKAPTGLIPQSVEVILQDDLVDKAKPGDRVQIVGVYKTITTGGTNNNAIFKTVIMATNIVVSAHELETPVFSAEDVRNIKEISKRDDLFKLLSHSVAPSIFGHEYIKKAILLMLLGGVEKNLENKAHLRGDINILMVGDPSTAKSQLLRRVLSISPLAINTTGRGSSGVGLTAAVVFDKETGEKHLEAGAMVLADRGIVCIDEFDKMEEADRVAIHEVMEQQTVTIAKAGIHTSLNARCSVIAAANPIYGEYQKDLPPTKNIGLPDSLLSRFDFLFIVLDEKDPKIDRMIAERVTRNHRYIHPSQEDNHLAGELDDDYVLEPDYNERADDGVFEKFNNVMHGSEKTEIITQSFLKKYIFYAKKTIVPVLTEEAVGYISNAWTTLRQKDADNTRNDGPKMMTITIRTLETVIRIATAHAKLRISKQVEQRDCEIAMELLNFALFGETPQEDQDNDEAMFDEDDDDNSGPGRRTRSSDNRRQPQTRERRDPDSRERRDPDSRERRDPDFRQSTGGKKSTSNETEIVTDKVFTRSQLREKAEEIKTSQDRIAKKSSKKPEPEKEGKISTTKEGKISTTKKDMESLTQKMKKTKLTSVDEEDLDGYLTMSISSSIEINDEAKRYVHKLIHEQFASVKDLLDDLLWETVKEQQSTMPSEAKKVLKRKEALIKVLIVLDQENRIMYRPEDKIIHKL